MTTLLEGPSVESESWRGRVHAGNRELVCEGKGGACSNPTVTGVPEGERRGDAWFGAEMLGV